MKRLLPFFLVLSGFASLVYQVTWVRLLGLSLGSTSASISTVLSAFFFGLALGSVLAAKVARNRALGAYAIVELTIAVCGAASLPILLNIDAVLALAPSIGTHLVPKLVFTFLLLLVPTTCMGATFPLMASLFVSRTDRLGLDIGSLYALNTFGAVLGAASSGFVLLPNWGLDGAIYIAVSANLLIFALAAMSLKSAGQVFPPAMLVKPLRIFHAPDRVPAAITLSVTGFAAIATQVGWNKYLSIFVGSTVYGFSVLLSVFLTGIALGSWLARRHIDRVASARTLMAFALVLTGLSLLLARAGLAYVPEIQSLLNAVDEGGETFPIRYAAIGMILLPPTLLFGAIFPLNLRMFCGSAEGVQGGVGRAYAINTMASILGALFAGFVAIPYAGTDLLLLSMAMLLVATSLIWLPRLGDRRVGASVSAGAALAALLVFWLPKVDYGQLIATVGYDSQSLAGNTPEYLFLKEGKAGVIGLLTYDGVEVKLQNNGLNEAQLNLEDPNDVSLIESLLGVLPYALHKAPSSAFVIGFGGGTTVGILADTDLASIDVVELEPAIVEAGRAIAKGPVSALEDPRVNLRFNDARNVLIVDDKSYDIIVSQPSHPWLAGSAGVFSRDFWAIASSRLNEGGVFGQWINLFRMDTSTLKSLMKAFYEVFPHGFVLANDENVLLIGSKAKVMFDYARFQEVLSSERIRHKMAARDIHTIHDVLWYFKLSRDEVLTLTEDAVPNLDTNILSELRLARLLSEPQGTENPRNFFERTSAMNVMPFLGANATSKLGLLAMYFLKEEAFGLAALAETQLAHLDARAARIIEHRRHLAELDYASAQQLYRRYSDWPAESHIAQARAYLELDDLNKAELALASAGVGASIHNELQRVGYLRGTNAVAASHSTIWSLLSDAERNLPAAGRELALRTEAGSVDDEGADLFVYRILTKYFASTGDDERLDRAAVGLAQAIDRRVERLEKIAEKAAQANSDVIARQAESAIKRLRGGPA